MSECIAVTLDVKRICVTIATGIPLISAIIMHPAARSQHPASMSLSGGIRDRPEFHPSHLAPATHHWGPSLHTMGGVWPPTQFGGLGGVMYLPPGYGALPGGGGPAFKDAPVQDEHQSGGEGREEPAAAPGLSFGGSPRSRVPAGVMLVSGREGQTYPVMMPPTPPAATAACYGGMSPYGGFYQGFMPGVGYGAPPSPSMSVAFPMHMIANPAALLQQAHATATPPALAARGEKRPAEPSRPPHKGDSHAPKLMQVKRLCGEAWASTSLQVKPIVKTLLTVTPSLFFYLSPLTEHRGHPTRRHVTCTPHPPPSLRGPVHPSIYGTLRWGTRGALTSRQLCNGFHSFPQAFLSLNLLINPHTYT